MKKMTYPELRHILCKFNEDRQIHYKGGNECIHGVIVFKSENWPDNDYSLESRSYVVSSDNKAFIPGMGGYSIFGSSLDGSDRGVRLEQYMEYEYGDWKVDYCYLLEEGNDE
jgi:hypothetical protein